MQESKILKKFNDIEDLRRAYISSLEDLHEELQDETGLEGVKAVQAVLDQIHDTEAQLYKQEQGLLKIVLRDHQD